MLRFVLTPEGLLFLAGWTAFFAGWAFLVPLYAVDPALPGKILTQVTTELLLGREAAIPVGLGLGIPPLLVMTYSLVQDVVAVLWIYPLVYAYREQLRKRRTIRRWIDSLERAASADRSRVAERFGLFGIALFVWIPFQMTGPVVGSVVGLALGYPTRRILPVVVVATAIAVASWTFFFDSIGRYVHSAVVVGFAALVILALLGHRVLAAIRTRRALSRDFVLEEVPATGTDETEPVQGPDG